ncbi:hypothetical protein AAG570_005239 [Ranatra chinensis]|uniref:SAP domain-containing protein n=1 Tax=Ranatra chinensis TaxID=642074 RepID=A0ABD0XZW0_9HEMI
MSEENISGLPLDSNFNKMKVVDIRKILRAKGLSAEGNKSDLIQRLTEHYSSTPKKSFSSSEAGVFDEDLEKSPVNEDTLMKSLTDDEEEMAVEDEVGSKDAEPSIEEEDDEELVTQEEQEVDDGEGGQESPANNKRKMQSDMAEGQTGEGETTQAISSGSEPRSEGSDLSKNDDTAASTTMTAPATSSSSAKKIIKLSDVSSRESIEVSQLTDNRTTIYNRSNSLLLDSNLARNRNGYFNGDFPPLNLTLGVQVVWSISRLTTVPKDQGSIPREKLAKRAEKFGLTEAAKKEIRAARFGIQTPEVGAVLGKSHEEKGMPVKGTRGGCPLRGEMRVPVKGRNKGCPSRGQERLPVKGPIEVARQGANRGCPSRGQ